MFFLNTQWMCPMLVILQLVAAKKVLGIKSDCYMYLLTKKNSETRFHNYYPIAALSFLHY